jgi:hypothetical protein
MTQATPTPPPAHAVADALVARYQAAQAALDADANTAVQPSPAVRANVLAYAQQLADARMTGAAGVSTTTFAATSTSSPQPSNVGTINSVATQAVNTWAPGSFEHKKSASNDSQWKIKALASVAVFGLSSLLFVQWQNATPDEQDAAFSVQRPAPTAAPSVASAAAPAAAPAPLTATATAPAIQSESVAAPAASAMPRVPSVSTEPATKSTAVSPPPPVKATAKAPSAAAAGVAVSKPPDDATSQAVAKQSAPAPIALPSPAAETRALDKESAKAQAAAAAPAAAPAAAAAAAAAAAPAAAPAIAAAPSPAAAQARARVLPPDANAAQSQDSTSAARDTPSGSFANKDVATSTTNPAGTASTIDHLAAGAARSVSAAAPKPFPQSAPLVATASVNSALFNAIRSKNRNALQSALDSGADKNAKDNGTPAITLCVQTGQTELVRLLAAAGADVNALDAQGISALEHARGRGLQDIIAVLMQYGAK